MKNKGVKLRIALYILILILVIILKYTSILDFGCYINKTTGLQCPTCGFTRATLSVTNLDIKSAINYNSFYTLVFLPIFLVLLIQDIYCIIMSKLKAKKYISFIEVIFGG